MPTETLEQRLAAIEKLLRLFRFERFVYLTVTLLSLVMLLTNAGFLVFERRASPVELSLLFGASGPHQNRRVTALIDSFFGLDAEFRASDPDVGEPDSTGAGVEVNWQERLAPPLPRWGCSDGAGPVPPEPSKP